MSLENEVRQSYEVNVKNKSKLKKAAEYVLIGSAAVLGTLGLDSCIRPPKDGEPSKPIISNVEAYSEDTVGDLGLSFTVDTFEGTQVYLEVWGNGEMVYKGGSVGAIKEDGGANVNCSLSLDTNILDSNLFPYHVDIKASGDSEFNNAGTYSTDLTLPMLIFGRKSPERVEKFESLLEGIISSGHEPFQLQGMYGVDNSDSTFRVKLDEGVDNCSVLVDGGGFLSLRGSRPSDSESLVNYSVISYVPPSYSPDMSLEQFLEMLDIKDFTVVPPSTVVAPRPLELFQNSKVTSNENVFPVYLIEIFLADDTGRFIGFQERYFEGETLSRTPLKRIDYFINRDDILLVGKETGNILSIFADLDSLEEQTAAVVLFSPSYFVGLLPDDSFYDQSDAIILDNDWDNRIYRFSEMPEEYKSLVIQSLDEAEAAIDELTNP